MKNKCNKCLLECLERDYLNLLVIVDEPIDQFPNGKSVYVLRSENEILNEETDFLCWFAEIPEQCKC